MKNRRLIHIVGNRPQFIKLSMLYNAVAANTAFDQLIIHTGQHSSLLMSDVFFKELLIPSPDMQLDMQAASADDFIGKTATKIHTLLSDRGKQDIVFVYGDTNSTLAGALAAKRNGNHLVHFESGVRTYDNTMPEEINRILTDRLAQSHYCCTEKNKKTLISEGYGSAIDAHVLWTGDLMLDAFLKIASSEKKVNTSTDYIACTIHRAANIANRENLQQIISALNEIHKEVEVIIPLHPHTAKRVREFNIKLYCTTIEPLAYRVMKSFISDSDYVITDSGGAAREAYFAGKRSLVIMEHPFWNEIVEAGAALNCGADMEVIIDNFHLLNGLVSEFDHHIFGDGHAAEKIADHLITLGD